MRVHERINNYIKNSGFKQYAIAQKAGYGRKQFSAMLTGRKKLTGEDIENICAALSVSAAEFIKPNQKVG